MNLVSYRAQGTISTAQSSGEQPAIAEPKPSAGASLPPLIVETPLSAHKGDPSSRQPSRTKDQAAPKTAAVETAPAKRAAEKAVVAKSEPKIPEVRPVSAAKVEPKDSETIAAEQVASARVKQTELAPEKKTSARPAMKNLEGFVIQLAFTEANAAQRWAKTLGQRGYTTSITEAGAEGSFRVRVGNFALREEADRQLRSLRQEGLSGIVINLPQAYRPDVRSSSPPDADKSVSINQ